MRAFAEARRECRPLNEQRGARLPGRRQQNLDGVGPDRFIRAELIVAPDAARLPVGEFDLDSGQAEEGRAVARGKPASGRKPAITFWPLWVLRTGLLTA